LCGQSSPPYLEGSNFGLCCLKPSKQSQNLCLLFSLLGQAKPNLCLRFETEIFAFFALLVSLLKLLCSDYYPGRYDWAASVEGAAKIDLI